MSAHQDRYLDLCAAQALGALDPGDSSDLEQHLRSGCPECEEALADFSAATVLLAASARPVLPDASLKQRILDSVLQQSPVSATRPPTAASARTPRAPGSSSTVPSKSASRQPAEIFSIPQPRPASSLRWLPLALAAGLAVAAVTGWLQASRLRQELESSQGQLSALRLEMDQTLSRLQEEQAWAAAIGGSYETCIVALQMTADAPAAAMKAQAIYEPASQKALLLVDNLKAPSGRDYQLWVIQDKVPQSLGLIQTDASGHAVLRLEKFGSKAAVSAFAISLEPAGGAPTQTQPTGPVVLMGSVPA